MNYSTIKEIKDFCNALESQPDWRDVVEGVAHAIDEFTVDGVRFINTHAIDDIQQDELRADLYVLGCFNAGFLAEILELDKDCIEAVQKAEAFEGLGKLIIAMDKLEDLQAEYARLDGYGHHFNHYDFSEAELQVGPRLFHVFDQHECF